MNARSPFRDLCTQLCQALQLPEPALPTHPGRPQGFRLRKGSCDLHLVQFPHDPPDAAHALVDLGPVDTEGCRQLLMANGAAALAGAAVFARNPANGHAMLQAPLPCGPREPQALLEAFQELTDLAQQWRKALTDASVHAYCA